MGIVATLLSYQANPVTASGKHTATVAVVFVNVTSM